MPGLFLGGGVVFSRCTNNNSISPPFPPFLLLLFFKNPKPEVKSVVSLALSNSKRYQSQEGTAGVFCVFLFFVLFCGVNQHERNSFQILYTYQFSGSSMGYIEPSLLELQASFLSKTPINANSWNMLHMYGDWRSNLCSIYHTMTNSTSSYNFSSSPPLPLPREHIQGRGDPHLRNPKIALASIAREKLRPVPVLNSNGVDPTKQHAPNLSLHTLPQLKNPPIGRNIHTLPYAPQTLHIPRLITPSQSLQILNTHPHPPCRFRHHRHLLEYGFVTEIFQPDP